MKPTRSRVVQRKDVWDVMKDGRPHTLADMSRALGYPEQSISARVRDFRKAVFGGHGVLRTPHPTQAGVYLYTLVRSRPQP